MALTNFRAPPLPYPNREYSLDQQRALVRNLEIYFSQLDSNTPNYAQTYTAEQFIGGVFFESSESFTGSGTLGVNTSIALVDCSSAAVTITLPAAATVAGKTVTIKKTDNSANSLIIEPDGSETIDKAANITTTSPYIAYKLHCDGTEWWIV